jgi:hypothetical protein
LSVVESLIQSPAGLRQLRLVEVLTGLGPVDDHHQVEIEALEKDPAQFGFSTASLESDLKVMKSWDWVDFWPSMEGIGSVMVKQGALDAAKEYRTFMKNKVRRNKACRDAYLHWLYEGDDSPGDFHSECTFYGSPYSELELKDAKNWLDEEGFIVGKKTADNGIYYAQITSKGTRAVESGRSVNDWHAGGILMTDRSINITGSSNVNVAQDSSNVTQSNTLTQEQLGKISDVIESYRALSGALNFPEEQLEVAETLVGELEEEAADVNAEPGKIRKALERLTGIVAEHGAKGVSTALISVIEQALQFLG